jgi:hypothetical protein
LVDAIEAQANKREQNITGYVRSKFQAQYRPGIIATRLWKGSLTVLIDANVFKHETIINRSFEDAFWSLAWDVNFPVASMMIEYMQEKVENYGDAWEAGAEDISVGVEDKLLEVKETFSSPWFKIALGISTGISVLWIWKQIR